ncbi:MAG TPA: SIR2 family protein [Polyangiaceae bacterium]
MPARVVPASVRRLKTVVSERPVTLVLGAGVSASRGVPDWRVMTRKLWQTAFATELPVWLREHSDALERVKEWARANESPEFAERLCVAEPHPLADQMALELSALRIGVSPGKRRRFVAALRGELYPAAPARKRADTLSVLARLLSTEQRRDARRVVRVITFNADDHLETEANGSHHPKRDPVLWPVSRESSHARTAAGANGRPPLPVYHLHGFLPRAKARMIWQQAADTLVFTDAQYWATVASPLSFANRVFSHALHDSACVFIGLSMRDVNILRWLGVRYNAIAHDKTSQRAMLVRQDEKAMQRSLRLALDRHFWVRPDRDDAERLVSMLVRERGVTSVPLERWGAPFEALLTTCFGRF